MVKNRTFTWAFFTWVLLITILSLVSFSADPTNKLNIPHLDKAVHFVFYFVASILGVFFLKEACKARITSAMALLASFLFVLIYGTILEVVQGVLTQDRSGEFRDVLANTAGGALGILLVKLWFRGGREQNWKH